MKTLLPKTLLPPAPSSQSWEERERGGVSEGLSLPTPILLPGLGGGKSEAKGGGKSEAKGGGYLCGIDEAGRGALAGPVVAAAVILPEDFDPAGIGDSKKLTAKQREKAYERIVKEALCYGIGQCEAGEIDTINILRATHEAMRRALAALSISPDEVRVDGLPVPNLHPNCKNLIGGDGLDVAIGAASILAKVTRDRLMIAYDVQWPEYGFAGHKGYGAATHLAALDQHGPCPIHRRTFGPVAQLAMQF